MEPSPLLHGIAASGERVEEAGGEQVAGAIRVDDDVHLARGDLDGPAGTTTAAPRVRA